MKDTLVTKLSLQRFGVFNAHSIGVTSYSSGTVVSCLDALHPAEQYSSCIFEGKGHQTYTQMRV